MNGQVLRVVLCHLGWRRGVAVRCMNLGNSGFCLVAIGVEFGARMINIDGKQIKLQIWDTVRQL